jgi:serine/threonine-protein kinase HipA
MDYLLGVDDVGRVGALRFRNATGEFMRTPENGERGIPPLLELGEIVGAAHAVERGTETAARGRIVYSDGIPIALIRRFDRMEAGRIPYLSATSMLQASREDEHTYSEIAERILSVSPDARRDLAELWRRIVFNMLITNVDDHLNNHGFLHVGHGQWRLAPAFDLNPFPDEGRDPKTWLTEETGPTGKIKDAMHAAGYFHLTDEQALGILGEVHGAVSQWRQVARNVAVGMTIQELEVFDAAFEHEEAQIAKQWLA